jgi:hypothetical protein
VPFRLLLLLLAAAALLPVTTASSAPLKPFEMEVAPGREFAGVTDDSYTVTLTNETKTQQLGSANIRIPGALTVVATSHGPVTTDNVLELRNLGVPPGGSVTVTLELRMTCEAGNYVWQVDAKQSNDFSGPPGNAMDLVTPVERRTTTVDGSCKLSFFAQPRRTEADEQIRAVEFAPQSTEFVSVEAIDGRPEGAERLTWFEQEIEVTLVQTDGGNLTPSPARSTATAGLAQFEDLAIDASGIYNLRAGTAAAGVDDADSDEFRVIGVVEECRPPTCRAQVADSALTATVENAGLALLSQNLGTDPDCGADYDPPTDDWYEFELTVAGDKTVETFYTRAEVRRAGGSSKLEICFAAPDNFPAEFGTEPFDYDGDPANGAEGFVGVLPDCPSTPVTPCRDGHSGVGDGAAIVRFIVPEAWSGVDPRYH